MHPDSGRYQAQRTADPYGQRTRALWSEGQNWIEPWRGMTLASWRQDPGPDLVAVFRAVGALDMSTPTTR